MTESLGHPVTNQPLSEVDPDVARAIEDELGRQRSTLEMIASENFAPRAAVSYTHLTLPTKRVG